MRRRVSGATRCGSPTSSTAATWRPPCACWRRRSRRIRRLGSPDHPLSNPTPEPPLPRPERTSVAPGIQRARRARRQTRFPQTGDPTRLAVWALAVLIAVLAALGWFGLGAERHLAIA